MVALLLLLAPLASALGDAFEGQFVSGIAVNANGTKFLQLLDSARRMFSAGDPELMTLSGVYDSVHFGATEGSVWSGNIWTQNSYGVGFASLPFLPQPQLQWMQTGFLWWFDHMGDGGQTFGGMPDVPDGMLCDNGNPTGCNYMQCGPGRRQLASSRDHTGRMAEPEAVFPSKRRDTQKRWEQTQDFAASTAEKIPTLDTLAKLHAGDADTPGIGHDWVIGGTLAGGVMQAEMLLTTRNMTAVRRFLPQLHRISTFMEGRRVQDDSPLTPGTKGLFRAGNGADLLAPSFGGWPLPVGCVVNATFSNCTQRAMSYLTELTVTYSALLDRMIQLEQLLYPAGGHNCTQPNADAVGPADCLGLYKARRAANEASLKGVIATMDSGSAYLIRSIDPNGEKHGVYAPRPPCPVDEPCPAAKRHGYFESAPNHDAVGLRVVSDDLAASIHKSMTSIEGLRPCDFTLPNFPDYDDSCGGCDGGYGTWVSGGSWSTAEGRAILAHFRGGRPDLAANSMARILDPYAKLFKLDNPIAHQGCGPGMYSQSGGGLSNKDGVPILDIDIFGIPAAFLHGVLGYSYGSGGLIVEPTLPDGVNELQQHFPVRFGNISIFFSMSGSAPPPAPPAPAPPSPPKPPHPVPWSCDLFGCTCQGMANYYGVYSGDGFACAPLEAQAWWDKQGGVCGGATKANVTFCSGPGCTASNPCATSKCHAGKGFSCTLCSDGSATSCATGPSDPVLPPVVYQWWQLPTKVEINGAECPSCLVPGGKNRTVTLNAAQLHSVGPHVAVHISFGQPTVSAEAEKSATIYSGSLSHQRWSERQVARATVSLDAIHNSECTPPAAVQTALRNSTAFSVAMAKAGLAETFEAAQAAAFREAVNASITRCDGRASGSIGPIPAEPASWKKYNMAYNQSAAEYYFIDQYNRIWTGLVNLMAAYSSSTSGLASPEHMKIAALFAGKTLEEAQAIALAIEKTEADRSINALEEQLALAREKRASLDAAKIVVDER